MLKENADSSQGQLNRARLVEALSELYELLENYAPVWYTEAHHEKAEAALRAMNAAQKVPRKLTQSSRRADSESISHEL